MAKRYDAVIVGGGHNGLVAACYLAEAGISTLVLANPENEHFMFAYKITIENLSDYSVQLLRRRQHH